MKVSAKRLKCPRQTLRSVREAAFCQRRCDEMTMDAPLLRRRGTTAMAHSGFAARACSALRGYGCGCAGLKTPSKARPRKYPRRCTWRFFFPPTHARSCRTIGCKDGRATCFPLVYGALIFGQAFVFLDEPYANKLSPAERITHCIMARCADELVKTFCSPPGKSANVRLAMQQCVIAGKQRSSAPSVCELAGGTIVAIRLYRADPRATG